MSDDLSHGATAAPPKLRGMTPPESVATSVALRQDARLTSEQSGTVQTEVPDLSEQAKVLAHQVETLTQALETRTQIATAVGMLMARENVSNEKAFLILRRASQRTNRKLRDIAIEMLESHHERVAPTEEPTRATA